MAINLEKIPNHKKRPHRKSDFGQAIMGLLIILAIIALPFVAVWLIWGATGIFYVLWIIGCFFAVIAICGLLSKTGIGCLLTVVCGIIAALFIRGADSLWKNHIDTQSVYQNSLSSEEVSSSSSITDVQGDAHVKGESQDSSENVTDRLQDSSGNYNRLETGDVPYKNHKARGRGKSEIKVKTSSVSQCDVVVIVKQQDKMVRNVYIQAGDSYTLAVPNGTFQVFFYYGRNWNPEKAMSTEYTGGFMEDEDFQKDTETPIKNQILTYELILQRNGNLQTQQSGKQEIF